MSFYKQEESHIVDVYQNARYYSNFLHHYLQAVWIIAISHHSLLESSSDETQKGDTVLLTLSDIKVNKHDKKLLVKKVHTTSYWHYIRRCIYYITGKEHKTIMNCDPDLSWNIV